MFLFLPIALKRSNVIGSSTISLIDLTLDVATNVHPAVGECLPDRPTLHNHNSQSLFLSGFISTLFSLSNKLISRTHAHFSYQRSSLT